MKQSVVAAAFISFISLMGLGLPFELFGAPPLDIKTTNAKAASTGQFQARGEYLARAGNCMGCHTAQGGRPYAGGRSLSTPFGTFVTPNISPDKVTGIGHWSADDFWKAMH